jgi:hypothetical protein
MCPGQHSKCFFLPLSEVAYDQFCELRVLTQTLQLNGDKDSWLYI